MKRISRKEDSKMGNEMSKGRGGRRHRLVYNNDRGFFSYLEPSMGLEAIIHEFIGRLKGTRIDTLIARIDRGNLVPMFDSEIEGKLGKGQTIFPTVEVWRNVTILRRLLDAGIDPYEVVFERTRQAGMDAFTGIRMNDLHHTKAKPAFIAWQNFFISDIAKNPRYFIGDDTGPYKASFGNDYRALNFMYDEVREHRFRIIQEIVQRYDLDGIELDFLRHGFYFPYSEVRQGMPLMTELLRRVRLMMDGIEKKFGHPICLMVRVPSWLEGCLQAGLDVPTWIREGLVDIVGLSAIAATEFDAPIKEFVELARGTHCEVLATFEYMLPKPYTRYLPEMARAGASWYYNQGVDGIYLFNAHCFYNPFADTSDVKIRILNYEEHKVLYNELHDPEVFRFRSKRYVVSKHSGRWPTYPRHLPKFWKRKEKGMAHRIIIKMAEDATSAYHRGLLESAELRLRMNWLSEEDEILVSFNNHTLSHLQRRIFGSGQDYLLKYPLQPDWVVVGENIVDVTLIKANNAVLSQIELTDVEVTFDYRNIPVKVNV